MCTPTLKDWNTKKYKFSLSYWTTVTRILVRLTSKEKKLPAL